MMPETFSFTRFAEYRPSTFTADYTIDIPTLAQYITDEILQPVNLTVWLELSSLTIKHLTTICSRLEEILSTTLVVGKNSFRTFPPKTNSFSLKINLLKYDKVDNKILMDSMTKPFDTIQKMLFKGLSWDIEKWVIQQLNQTKNESYFDPTRWDLLEAVEFIQQQSQTTDESDVRGINLLLLSCWHTEGPYEDIFQYIQPFDENYCSWNYLLTISPISGITVSLADLLGITYTDLLVSKEQLPSLNQFWKNALLTLIEPIMEVLINPTKIGFNYSVATNLTLFQRQKFTEEGFIIYTLRSQRYPIRINFLFELPVTEQKTETFGGDPVVLEEISLALKTSTGRSFKIENIKNCTTYKLPPNANEYQPERELNSRMRRASRLKTKLESILVFQSESNAQIKKMLVEPTLLTDSVQDNVKKEQAEILEESIDDLKLAFEIIDYLQEQELLLNELPPATKMFKPPENNNNSLI